MHRFPPLAPQSRHRRRPQIGLPPISLPFTGLPLGELMVFSFLTMLLAFG